MVKGTIPNIQRLLAAVRGNGSPVIFANDSFLLLQGMSLDDFLSTLSAAGE
ncbi:MAG: hypothetical protein AAGB97_00050 [Dehalococcoidia bacterium]